MHVAVSEFARHVCGMDGANSTEMDPETPFPVIDLLPEQKEIEDLGGTMRLGAQAVELEEGTRARETYGEPVVHERHRHRYEVNNELRQRIVDGGLVVSGRSRTAGSSRSSSSRSTRGSSRASSTRSSSRGRRDPRRSSASSSRRRSSALARAPPCAPPRASRGEDDDRALGGREDEIAATGSPSRARFVESAIAPSIPDELDRLDAEVQRDGDVVAARHAQAPVGAGSSV